MMHSFLLFLLVLPLSGIEPFLPAGSVLLPWSMVVGIKRRDAVGLVIAFTAGVFRDAALASHLGGSSVVFVVGWSVVSVLASRIEQPLLVAVAGTLIGTFGLSMLDRRIFVAGVGWNLFWCFIVLRVWEYCSERRGGIKIRGA